MNGWFHRSRRRSLAKLDQSIASCEEGLRTLLRLQEERDVLRRQVEGLRAEVLALRRQAGEPPST